MSTPLPAAQASRLDRILLHLGLLQQQIGDLGQTLTKADGRAVELERRVREVEQWKAGVEAGTKSSTHVWLFVWQAINSMAILGFTVATFVRGH